MRSTNHEEDAFPGIPDTLRSVSQNNLVRKMTSDVYIFSIFFFPVFVISGAPNLFQGSLGYVLIINIPEYFGK